MNSSQSTPAHSLCQTLGQCRRAKKATEQCNSEGAKPAGRETLICLSPALPRLSHNFSLYAFPTILKPGTGYPVHSTLTDQHQKKSFFTDLQRLTLICLLNVVHSSVLFKAAWVICVEKGKSKQMTGKEMEKSKI